MQVSLPALKAFESAARLGSFKAAAEDLSVSPTAVSHHINNLEQRLSVTLFLRTARKVTLTEPGKVLAEAASHGFQTIDAAIAKIAAKDKEVDVATTSSFAALVLIPALQAFYARCPEASVNITTGENVEPNNFVLPVRLGETGSQSSSDIIKQERFHLFAAPQAAGKFHKAKKPTVYTTRWKNRSLPEVPLQEWLQLNRLVKKKIEVRHFDQELFGIQQALQEGAYVFCSTTLVQGYVQAGLLAGVNAQAVDSRLCYYIANKDKHLSRHNMMFIEWLESFLE